MAKNAKNAKKKTDYEHDSNEKSAKPPGLKTTITGAGGMATGVSCTRLSITSFKPL